MSDLLRQSLNGAPPRPQPTPSSIPSRPELEDNDDDPQEPGPDSPSSSSSASTVRAITSNETPPWTNYFSQEIYLEQDSETQHAKYHIYITPPNDSSKGPLFVCHHGAGASGLSFALFAQHIHHQIPGAGVLSLEARAHGSIVTRPNDGEEIIDFSLETLTQDALSMIRLTKEHFNWPSLPPTILVGHSLGGAIVTEIAASHFKALGGSLVGFAVLDVVEGSALEALGHMKTYLAQRPKTFNSIEEAVTWHTRTRTIRSVESAEVSVPILLTKTDSVRYVWKTSLETTSPWWESWFTGLSAKFLSGRGAKLLLLAGTDRLDKDLMIGQMQGKFQLTVLPEAGHFIQEDVPERTAEILAEFWRRNDRSTLVLPPKVSELLAQGKKV